MKGGETLSAFGVSEEFAELAARALARVNHNTHVKMLGQEYDALCSVCNPDYEKAWADYLKQLEGRVHDCPCCTCED